MIYILYVLAYLVGSGLVMCIGAFIYTDRKLKTEMLNEQKKAEAIKWVDQLIKNIKDDELAY